MFLDLLLSICPLIVALTPMALVLTIK